MVLVLPERGTKYEFYGVEFKELYLRYKKEGRNRKTIPAQKLWYAILKAQIETGGSC